MQTVLELLVPFGHEKQLHGERIPVRIFIEIFQEGIIRKFFKDELTIVIPGKHFTERSLACSDISFDADILVWKRVAHPSAKIATSD